MAKCSGGRTRRILRSASEGNVTFDSQGETIPLRKKRAGLVSCISFDTTVDEVDLVGSCIAPWRPGGYRCCHQAHRHSEYAHQDFSLVFGALPLALAGRLSFIHVRDGFEQSSSKANGWCNVGVT